MLLVCSCSTTNLTTNQVGWSNYTDLVVKDFDVVGIVSIESTEVIKKSAYNFSTTIEGSRVTYTDLMKKAIELGADDIINVRIDKKENIKTSILDFLVGSTKTYTYIATETAIKYKDAKADVKAGSAVLNNELKNVSPAGNSLFDKLF